MDGDKQVMTNEPDSMVVVKGQERDVEVAVAFPSQQEAAGLTEQLERMWGVMTTVAPVLIGASGDVTPTPSSVSLSSRSQEQHLRSQSRRMQHWEHLGSGILMKWMGLIF